MPWGLRYPPVPRHKDHAIQDCDDDEDGSHEMAANGGSVRRPGRHDPLRRRARTNLRKLYTDGEEKSLDRNQGKSKELSQPPISRRQDLAKSLSASEPLAFAEQAANENQEPLTSTSVDTSMNNCANKDGQDSFDPPIRRYDDPATSLFAPEVLPWEKTAPMKSEAPVNKAHNNSASQKGEVISHPPIRRYDDPKTSLFAPEVLP